MKREGQNPSLSFSYTSSHPLCGLVIVGCWYSLCLILNLPSYSTNIELIIQLIIAEVCLKCPAGNVQACHRFGGGLCNWGVRLLLEISLDSMLQ